MDFLYQVAFMGRTYEFINIHLRYVCLEEVCIECHGDCAAFHIYVLIDFDLVKDMLLVFHITL